MLADFFGCSEVAGGEAGVVVFHLFSLVADGSEVAFGPVVEVAGYGVDFVEVSNDGGGVSGFGFYELIEATEV